MYDSYMNEVAVSDARNRLADVIEESRRSGEPISVTRRGKRVAVILESEAFDRLVDCADDAQDRRDLEGHALTTTTSLGKRSKLHSD